MGVGQALILTLDLNLEPWHVWDMVTPIEIWLFLSSRAGRKLSIHRMHRDAEEHFNAHGQINFFEAQDIIMDTRKIRDRAIRQCGNREDLFMALRDANHRAMMEYGSRKLKDAIEMEKTHGKAI